MQGVSAPVPRVLAYSGASSCMDSWRSQWGPALEEAKTKSTTATKKKLTHYRANFGSKPLPFWLTPVIL